MSKNRVRVALVAASAGLVLSSIVSGCSDDPPADPVAPVAVPDGGRPDRVVPPDPPPPDVVATCPGPEIIAQSAVEADLGGPWRGPGAAKAACSQGDIDAVKGLFANATEVAFADVEKAIGASCKACVFTPSTETTWGPFVRFGSGYYPNYAACLALATSEECGRQIAYAELCYDKACDESCGTGTQRTACVQKARAGACKTFADGVDRSCGAKLEAAFDGCQTVFQLMAATCGGVDGGLDASAN